MHICTTYQAIITWVRVEHHVYHVSAVARFPDWFAFALWPPQTGSTPLFISSYLNSYTKKYYRNNKYRSIVNEIVRIDLNFVVVFVFFFFGWFLFLCMRFFSVFLHPLMELMLFFSLIFVHLIVSIYFSSTLTTYTDVHTYFLFSLSYTTNRLLHLVEFNWKATKWWCLFFRRSLVLVVIIFLVALFSDENVNVNVCVLYRFVEFYGLVWLVCVTYMCMSVFCLGMMVRY